MENPQTPSTLQAPASAATPKPAPAPAPAPAPGAPEKKEKKHGLSKGGKLALGLVLGLALLAAVVVLALWGAGVIGGGGGSGGGRGTSTVRCTETKPWTLQQVQATWGPTVAASPDGVFYAVSRNAKNDQTSTWGVAIFDNTSDKQVFDTQANFPNIQTASAISFGPDYVVFAARDLTLAQNGLITLWRDASSGVWTAAPFQPLQTLIVPGGTTTLQSVQALAASPHENRAVYVTGNDTGSTAVILKLTATTPGGVWVVGTSPTITGYTPSADEYLLNMLIPTEDPTRAVLVFGSGSATATAGLLVASSTDQGVTYTADYAGVTRPTGVQETRFWGVSQSVSPNGNWVTITSPAVNAPTQTTGQVYTFAVNAQNGLEQQLIATRPADPDPRLFGFAAAVDNQGVVMATTTTLAYTFTALAPTVDRFPALQLFPGYTVGPSVNLIVPTVWNGKRLMRLIGCALTTPSPESAYVTSQIVSQC